MKVKFTENVTVPAGRRPGLYFKKGSIHDLREDQAWRWIKRNKAVVFVVEPKLKVGRPMMGINPADMGEAVESFDARIAFEIGKESAEAAKPKKRGRPKKGA